jgi:hypothetical protein
MAQQPEKKKKPLAWLVFAHTRKFTLQIPVNSELRLSTLNTGDALLLADREQKVATGVRRIYLIRRETDHAIFYFDRIADFATSIPLEQIGYTIPDAPALVWKLEVPKLEKTLQLARLPEFRALPELSADDADNQRYVRDLLQQAVVDDLLGPADGAEEEIVGMSVRDRYLVGKLAPRVPYADDEGVAPFSDAEEQTEPEDLVLVANRDHNPQSKSVTGSEDDTEDDAIDATTNQSLVPSSLGFTFCIDGALPEFELIASWGRYERSDSESVINPRTDNPQRCWKRIPAGGTLKLQLAEGRITPRHIDPSCQEVFIQGSVSRLLSNESRMVTIFLVNAQLRPDINQDAAWIFQPELRVKSSVGEPIFMRRPLLEVDENDEELKALGMIYRKNVEFAVGHGIAVHATRAADDYEKATEIRTTVLPQYEIPVMEAPGIESEDRPALKELHCDGRLDMRRLAELSKEELIAGLSLLTDDYAAWIAEQKTKSQISEFIHYSDSAAGALSHCDEILARLREGLAVIGTNELALDSFRFANRVMANQRVHSMYALSKRRSEHTQFADFDKAKNHSWRPFQLAFVLLSIPSLADPAHKDRTSPLEAYADLLWFPTGGGKTEAYLGVAAFAMGIRRLQGELGGLDSSRGLSVIMRYTLRLLTIQQFQRATALICAMETERRRKPEKWGNEPFSIGLWVGQKTTPNTTDESHVAIEREREHQFGTGSTPAQLTTCPWCGSEIQPGREIIVNKDIGRTRIFCGDPLGRCEFSRTKSENGLPVIVVDEEIYHRPPTMLIATVDKFAMMAWKGAVRTLFGKVSHECPRHGLLWPDADCKGRHPRRGSLDATDVKTVKPIRPPDLIIQDEFHLISGPLGTMVGLYEAAIDDLSTWTYDGKEVRPKVVASTATVRKAEQQINNVFLRQVSIFPPHGIDVEDNFFSVQRPIAKRAGRRYIGICSPGSSRPAVLIRVYVALLTGAQSLFEHFGLLADPYMTLVGYFNSLRELGGMRRLAEDDVQTRSFRVALATEVKRPGLIQRRVRNVDELTSRVSNKEIPRKLDHLEVKFKHEWARDDTRAVDIVLATNMLSVGVDVNRLGLMVVNGQPKNTAEYIQATSRVGRSFPGLVCTVLTWSRPRDFSHYETFEHYHSTFYKHVEAQSVTPFASRALDRGLTGAMISMIRLENETFTPNLGALEMKNSGNPVAAGVKQTIVERAWRVEDKSTVKTRTEIMAAARIDRWVKEAKIPGRQLGYEKINRQGDVINLLKKPGIDAWDEFTVPISMREVEPGVRLIMDKATRISDEPEWKMHVSVDDNADNRGEA